MLIYLLLKSNLFKIYYNINFWIFKNNILSNIYKVLIEYLVSF